MKNDPRRFAPLGLVLAVLAVLSFFIILIIKGLSSAGIFNLPDPKVIDQAMWVSLAIVVLGLAATAFLDPEGTRKFFVGRQVQYGSNSFIMLAAFLGILFFVNLIAYQNPVTKDMTEDKSNSLAPETLKLLSSLPQPIAVRAYYSSRVSRDSIQKLLDNFKQNSQGKLTYEYHDIYQDPSSIAQQDGVARDSTLVLQMGSRKQTSSLGTEQDIDTAILRLINPQSSVIYFLTGEGERDTESQGDTSLSLVKAALQNKNYTVKVLNLKGASKIPADAKTIIIAGPQQPLDTNEVAALKAYLEQGGGVIAMEDTLAQLPKFGNGPDPLADLLTTWGITLQNDVIIDPNVSGSQYILADTQKYGQHPITDSLHGYNSAFFNARSLKLADPAPDGITVTALAQTLENAWGETDFSSNTVSFDPNKDFAGPLVLAAAAENSATKGRLVVFGDSKFAFDPYYQGGNGDILINSVDWTANQANLISLTPKNNIARTYQPPTTAVLIGIFLLSLCIIPLLVVGAGIAAWYSRRRRG